MLLNGQLWIDYDGKILGVVYQSKVESIEKEKLINAERKSLHPSIKEYKQPIHILETTKFRIRIDDLGNGKYRYTSWSINNKMSEKPDIILDNGEYIPEGSGGNHTYEFKNKEFIYDCAIIVMGEDVSPPARLTIYKGDKEIISQKAQIVRY